MASSTTRFSGAFRGRGCWTVSATMLSAICSAPCPPWSRRASDLILLVSTPHHLWFRQIRFDENVEPAATVALHRNVDDALPFHVRRRRAAEREKSRSAFCERLQRVAHDDVVRAASANPAGQRSVGRD